VNGWLDFGLGYVPLKTQPPRSPASIERSAASVRASSRQLRRCGDSK
jgi:hypothetical protein